MSKQYGHLRVYEGGIAAAVKKELSSPRHAAWLTELDHEYQRLIRRVNRINSLRNGDAGVKTIRVKQSRWIPRHRRRAHTRTIIVLNKEVK